MQARFSSFGAIAGPLKNAFAQCFPNTKQFKLSVRIHAKIWPILAAGWLRRHFIKERAIPLEISPSLSSLMAAAEHGDSSETDALFSALYRELHRIAKRELSRQGFAVSLGATTLLHQAYIELAAKDGRSFPDQPRFMAYAARVMRGLIIDHARRRYAQKRGGQFEFTSDAIAMENAVEDRELEYIGNALDQLMKTDPLLAEIVDLKFFCGFKFDEIAGMKGISERTVRRQWEKARIFLHRAIEA